MKKTPKKQKQFLLQRQQWLIVAVLVAVLFVFACLVYGADMAWNAEKSV